MVDNVDLRDLDVKLHRRRIGVVTQDPILFHGTIFENIVYGCDHASREDAEEAARLANAWNFINSFPDKFETDGKLILCPSVTVADSQSLIRSLQQSGSAACSSGT